MVMMVLLFATDSERAVVHGMEVYCVYSKCYMNPMASGCLALAELGRRGLLLPDRLKEGKYLCLTLDS